MVSPIWRVLCLVDDAGSDRFCRHASSSCDEVCRLYAGDGVLRGWSWSAHIRLSFCYPTPERIKVGVERLAGVMREELEIAETFGLADERRHSRDLGPGPNLA